MALTIGIKPDGYIFNKEPDVLHETLQGAKKAAAEFKKNNPKSEEKVEHPPIDGKRQANSGRARLNLNSEGTSNRKRARDSINQGTEEPKPKRIKPSWEMKDPDDLPPSKEEEIQNISANPDLYAGTQRASRKVVSYVEDSEEDE